MSNARLGWTIHGVISVIEKTEPTQHINLCCHHTDKDAELHSLIKDSFRLDNFGISLQGDFIKSVEDKKAIEIMEKTIRKVGNHYEIGHLWRNEDEVLPDSRHSALKRLQCMERKMNTDSAFAKQYSAKINEYLEKGYARKLSPAEIVDTQKTWFLPHFAVWNVNKTGKIRMVFDAAAKSHSRSLNDFLLQGPNLVPSLVAVLWRFRQGRFAVNADIKEMFHQVLIRKEDRCAQRFFWRGEDKCRAPDTYEMNVMIFGAVSSPSIAQFVKNKNAEQFETKCPGITRIMKQQHYVDDYLDSFNTEDEAIKTVKNVIYVHLQGGFKMVKWVSNSVSVMKSIPEDLRALNTEDSRIDDEKIKRVLGLFWSPSRDNFAFQLNLKKIDQEIWVHDKTPTKREVLRVIMSIFDPLGFLAPIMIKARLLMQNIWRTDLNWDTEITECLFESWKRWIKQIQSLVPLYIPRCYFPESNVRNVDLHIFCDASDKAYAAVAFLRLEIGSVIQTSFVQSKYKVAPLKQQTVPKLELQGAVLGCGIGKSIRSELDFNIEHVHYWTDSMVVLNQIRSESRRFPIFVASRVGEIQEQTHPSQWHWIPSDKNVADLATKEVNFVSLNSNSPWLKGPDFLSMCQNSWPLEPMKHCQEECVLLTTTTSEFESLPDIRRFSKWTRLVRSTAWLIHFVEVIQLQKSIRPEILSLGAEEIIRASTMWICKSQLDYFSEELKLLPNNRKLTKSSKLFKLSAFIDKDSIVRVGGRIPNNIDIEYDFKYPIILDCRHQYTQLLIRQFHDEAGHVGLETVANNIRMKYWVIGLRNAVKKCFRNCRICQIRHCKPNPPEMGNLPRERLTSFVHPFTHVGIDLFGPMTVSIGRRVEKRYGVLFTCLTLRAVHIELASSLDTSSTILAIRRFMSRRGQPKEIFSDNGTNFIGAERELKEWIQAWDQAHLTDFLSTKGILWKFNPPLAAHMGGIWERMIRSVKTALKVTLTSVNPKEEVLLTLLLEVEYMVNSRPLTHISVDPMEPEAITPNHFLLMRPGGMISYGTDDKIGRKQWRNAQTLAEFYWRRWIKEYRPTLVQRSKWHSKTEQIKIGDVVVIVDEKLARNQWLLGRIVQVFPGKDETVRVAQVKTKNGNYTRPVTKLCVLPTSKD